MCCFDWLVRSLCKRERPRPAAVAPLHCSFVCLAGREPYDPVLVYPEFALDSTVDIPKSGRRYCACQADARIRFVDAVVGRFGSLSKAFRSVQPKRGGVMTRRHIRDICSEFCGDAATEIAGIIYAAILDDSKRVTEKAFCNFFEPYIEITLEFEKEASTPKSTRMIVNPESGSGTCSAQASTPTTAPSTPPRFEGPFANDVSEGGAVDAWNKSEEPPAFQVRLRGDAIARVFDAAGDHANLMEELQSHPNIQLAVLRQGGWAQQPQPAQAAKTSPKRPQKALPAQCQDDMSQSCQKSSRSLNMRNMGNMAPGSQPSSRSANQLL
eukprot:symbB.v1.2.007884.t2/scaffold489.1/size197246/2